MSKSWIFICIVGLCASCTSRYGAGNVGALADLETNVRLRTIKQISDTLFDEGRFLVPTELRKSLDIQDYDFLDYRNYYLEDPPYVYMVTFDDVLTIRMIYDVRAERWLTRESGLTAVQLDSLERRFELAVIGDVLKRAKKMGLPDSVVWRKN